MKRNNFILIVLLSMAVVACQSSGEDRAQQAEQEDLSPVPLSEEQKKRRTVRPKPTAPKPQPKLAQGKIEWMGLSAAMQAQQQDPKPIFIDLYTDWCGWCKVMDRKTFSQDHVAEYMNDNFYPVKFNAEKAGPINWGGKEHKLMSTGRKKVHSLAFALLDGNLGYPAYVVLGENQQRKGFFKGYREASDFLSEVKDLQ